MAKPKFAMHIEASRKWLSGVSTTLCGLTFKVETSSWFGRVDCADCIRIDRDRKRAKKTKGGKR